SVLRAARVMLEGKVKAGCVGRLPSGLMGGDSRGAIAHRLAALLIRAVAAEPSSPVGSAPALSRVRLVGEIVASARVDGAARGACSKARSKPDRSIACTAI